ncbi:diguanylate cyclase [Kribbella sp. NPDC023972]|uniref:diguanylate cyclase n=1 Tax=Kribbella sp. NPDC023972 TaxID=3154795 RepID=UPI0033DD1092
MSRPPTGSDDATDVRQRLAVIHERARNAFANNVATLEGAVGALADGTLPETQRRDAEHAAHRLAGSAGTFGFPDATVLARELEESFATDPGPAAARVLAVRVEALRRSLLDETAADARTQTQQRKPIIAVHVDPQTESTIRDAAQARGVEVTNDVLDGGADAAIVDLGRREAASIVRDYAERLPPVPVVALGDATSLSDRLLGTGAGASVVVRREQSGPALIDTAESLAERRRRDKFRVLAVDDDDAILIAVSEVLAGDGYEVSTLGDARGFWEALEQTRPDLLVLDLDMPHVNGAELCRVVRADPRWSGLPVLFLTAHTDPPAVEGVFAAGADDYLAKPFGPSELRARIRNRLERVRLFRELADTDPLTGLANRRRMEEAFEGLRQLAYQHRQPLSLALLDLDHFKRVNDEHGHSAGDIVLRRLARQLTGEFRGEDIVARWGGEEIAVLAFGMSRAECVRRMRQILETFGSTPIDIPDDGPLHVTFSAGVAELATDGSDLGGLVRSADAALYGAKRAGRARVAAAAGAESTPAGTPADAPDRLDHADIRSYYSTMTETDRLIATGHGRLEYVRTTELLTAHLPPPPARVLDIGGATGIYARWLAGLGYQVHLVDIVPEHVTAALSKSPELTAAVGDARHLDEPDSSADAVLLLGPLYHLLQHYDRVTALREARRVLRPGGIVAAAVISRHAALLAAASRGTLDSWQRDLAMATLANGRHDTRLGFTAAYFHTPDEAVAEGQDAGFHDVTIHAIEGPMWAALKTSTNPSTTNDLLESALVCARAIEQDDALLAASAHLLIVGHT